MGQTVPRHDQQDVRLQHVHRVPLPDDEPVHPGAVHLVHRAVLLYRELHVDERIFRVTWCLDVECVWCRYYCWNREY